MFLKIKSKCKRKIFGKKFDITLNLAANSKDGLGTIE